MNRAQDRARDHIEWEGNQPRPLSARAWRNLTKGEKQAIRAFLQNRNVDPDDFERRIENLTPRQLEPKTITWRRNAHV